MNNPFVLTGYVGAEYFCDREKELALLHDHFQNDRNVVIYAWRRLGKTLLTKRFLEELATREDVEYLYIDLMSTRSTGEAQKRIGNALFQRFGKKGFSKNLRRLIGALGVEASFDPVTGMPSVSFSLNKPNEKIIENLQVIGDFLKQRKKKVVVALDEFQQVADYKEENGEAVFRDWVQSFPEIRFIFSGSRRNMMQSMFLEKNSPFYRSAQLLSLEPIVREKYFPFISEKFNQAGKKIEEDLMSRIYDWSNGQTYCIQLICNKLVANTKNPNIDDLKQVFQEVIDQESAVFAGHINMLSETQWGVLRAVALEERVANPLSSKFLTKYELKAASSVASALKKLIDHELVIKTEHNQHRVHDTLMMRWIQDLEGETKTN